jgi:O-antigen ligase
MKFEYLTREIKSVHPLTFLARAFALLALFSIPLSTAGVNIGATLFAVFAVLSPDVWRNWRLLFTNRVAVAAIALAAVLTLSLAWTEGDRAHAIDFLMKYRKLVYLPLLILVFNNCTRIWTTVAKWGMFSTFTCLLLLSTSNWLGWTAIGAWHSDTDPVRRAWVFKDHIAAGILMALLFYLALNLATQVKSLTAKIALYAVALLTLINELVMMQGRTGQIIVILFLLGYIFSYFAPLRNAKSSKRLLGGVALVAAAAGFLFLAVHAPGSRLAETHSEISAFETSNESTSMGIRIVYYERSLKLIAERPLFGHGVGSVQEEFEAFARNHTGAKAATGANPHNEFLLMGDQLGIVGIALFVFLLVQIGRSAFDVPKPARQIVLAYLFAFSIGCFVNSLLLNFTEGNVFIFLTGIFLSCRTKEAST